MIQKLISTWFRLEDLRDAGDSSYELDLSINNVKALIWFYL